MKILKHNTFLRFISGVIFFVSSMCLIVTSFEGPVVEKMYQFPESFIENEVDPAWQESVTNALASYQINLRHPEWVWYGESFFIQVSLIERAGLPTSENNALPSFVLEAYLEMNNVGTTPGEHILLPIQLPQTGLLQWEVDPQAEEIEQSRVWLSILPQEGGDSSIPVLVLPLEIKIRPLLGLKLGGWQMIWIGLGVISIGFYLSDHLKRNRRV
ncbi:MAG TPA: hypothetical protein PLL88_06490 [Anaerolineaceae bacterium]|nr:hypothetical protein [Anaerolineaceae bacterium]